MPASVATTASQNDALRTLMSRDVVEVVPSASLQQAARAMTEHGVGSAVVVERARVVGIVTERDILCAVANGADSSTARCRDWMTTGVITAMPDETIAQAAGRMLAGGFRHLPVVDDGELVGIVSLRDVAQAGAVSIAWCRP